MLLSTLLSKYRSENTETIFQMYLTTIKYKKELRNTRLNKKYLIENFLSTLWKEARV